MAFDKLEKEKQNKVLNAACEVFAKHGYKKASMKDIAEAAGVSKSVLFKYFSTKENLYIYLFRLASSSIREADDIARAEGAEDADLFALMRRSAKTRLALFRDFPWVYRFAYTAAFDTDPFVKALVGRELNDVRSEDLNRAGGKEDFRGLREDIPPSAARQVVLWVSQGYLEEKLMMDDIDPEALEKGFTAWIDILELLLKKSNENGGIGENHE